MEHSRDRETLSRRERDIAQRYATGASYKDIAEDLGISPATVRTHLQTIYRKRGVASKIELLRDLGPASQLQPKIVLPEVPSLAILPFKSIGSEDLLSMVAEGLVEELSVVLARVPDLFVVAESASAAAAASGARLKDIGEALGVAYALTGSVRSSGKRLRVSASLQGCATENTIWSERYETTATDVFDVQDDISRNIAVALQTKLTYGEMSRLWEGQTRNLRAWEKMAEARQIFNRYTRPDVLRARVLLEEALEIDPSYSGALLHLGLTHWWEARYVLERPVEEALQDVDHIVARLRREGAHQSSPLYLEGYAAWLRRNHDWAVAQMAEAAALSPSDAWKNGCLGQVRIFTGQDRAGLADLRRAMRLAPFYPDWIPYNLALALAWLKEEKDTALAISQSYAERVDTDPYAWVEQATVADLFDEPDTAAAAVTQLKQRYPDFRIANVSRSEIYADPARLGRIEKMLSRNGLQG